MDHQHAHDTAKEPQNGAGRSRHDAGHGANPPMGHAEHDHHRMMIEDFKRRFWVSLLLTAPILLLSPMIQMWLGFELRFPGDSLLLCSDGLWAYFPDEELGVLISTGTAREVAARLIDLARARGAGEGDNISVALLKFIDAPKAPAVSPYGKRP